jgi:two-component system, OmpR family, KDP operon response regulator KdpE
MNEPKPLVLVVEDDPQMRRFLRASLGAEGLTVLEAERGEEALGLAANHNPDIVLMDLGLPDADGIVLTRRLREWTAVPVIVLSARGREADKVEALDAGADDYLTKPFGVGELLARIRVALRHATASRDSTEAVAVVGALRVDFSRREVTRNGEGVHLTPIEYRLLALLLKNRGKVLTHRQILKDVWGPSDVDRTHHLRVHMAGLRRKIERDPARPRLLVTELGVGYRLKDEVETTG